MVAARILGTMEVMTARILGEVEMVAITQI